MYEDLPGSDDLSQVIETTTLEEISQEYRYDLFAYENTPDLEEDSAFPVVVALADRYYMPEVQRPIPRIDYSSPPEQLPRILHDKVEQYNSPGAGEALADRAVEALDTKLESLNDISDVFSVEEGRIGSLLLSDFYPSSEEVDVRYHSGPSNLHRVSDIPDRFVSDDLFHLRRHGEEEVDKIGVFSPNSTAFAFQVGDVLSHLRDQGVYTGEELLESFGERLGSYL